MPLTRIVGKRDARPTVLPLLLVLAALSSPWTAFAADKKSDSYQEATGEAQFWQWFSGSRPPNTPFSSFWKANPLPLRDTTCRDTIISSLKQASGDDPFLSRRIAAGDFLYYLGASYILDSAVSASCVWRLNCIGFEDHPTATYLYLQQDPCTVPFWIGRQPATRQYFSTTILGRFVCLGFPYDNHEGPDWEVEHALDQDGNGRTVGDTIFVHHNAITHMDVTDSLFVLRFARAIELLGPASDHLTRRKVAELYMVATYPLWPIVVLESPSQLDQLYLFEWSDFEKVSSGEQDTALMRTLKKPGIIDGRLLALLPENASAGALPLPLPSVLLSKYDGKWFQHSRSDGDALDHHLSLTVLVTGDMMLSELTFYFQQGSCRLERVGIERLYDMSGHLQK